RAHRRAVGHRGVRRGLAGRQLGGHRRRRRPPHPSPSHAVRDVRRHCPRLHRKGIARLMPDITMPQLGETVTEGTITKWFKQVGDEVSEDEPLFEVSTDKVDSEVPSPESGYLAEILVEEGETVDVGTKLAVVSSEAPSGDGQTGGDKADTKEAEEEKTEGAAEVAEEEEEEPEAEEEVDEDRHEGGEKAEDEEAAAEGEPADEEARPEGAEAEAEQARDTEPEGETKDEGGKKPEKAAADSDGR